MAGLAVGRKSRSKKRASSSEDDGGYGDAAVRVPSSSDDEDANRDLSLEILDRAKQREAKRARKAERKEVDGPVSVTLSNEEKRGEKKKKRGRKKDKKEKDKQEEKADTAADQEKVVDVAIQPVKPVDSADPVETEVIPEVNAEVNEAPDDIVMRKLLRGPRYFDTENCNWASCFNCGEEGHFAANCTKEKRQKPCFVCGEFGHNAKHCVQGQNCFICKRRGHAAKDCPDKNQKTSQTDKFCLRCGESGHDMFSCSNDYPLEDLKEIQCYVCKNFGHLCCAEFIDTGPREVSCYNCGLPGHSGAGCAKPRWQTSGTESQTVCYRCGEEGHFARGCTKKAKPRHLRDDATTTTPKHKKSKDHFASRSAPHDLGKTHKKKKVRYDEWSMTPTKPRIKGGWVVDDPGDVSYENNKRNAWASPSKSSRKSQGKRSPNDRYSGSQSPYQKHVRSVKTPNSSSSYGQYYSASRVSRFNNSSSFFGRSWQE